MATPCMCTNEKCNHPNGEPCGKPVENPLTVQAQGSGHVVGPWIKIGLCEACWKNRPAWKRMADKILH
jgi:hypothetical protein